MARGGRCAKRGETRRFKAAAYAHLAEVGKALSSPARLEILELLSHAPRSVEALANEIEQSVANTSHHLGALKRARLVKSRKEGLRVIYSLTGTDVAELVRGLHAVGARHIEGLEALKREFFGALEGLEPVDRDTLIARAREGEVVLVDVRPEWEYERGHAPGAISLPLDSIGARLTELPRDRTIVAYCRGPFCALSAEAVRLLRELGFDARRTEATFQELIHA